MQHDTPATTAPSPQAGEPTVLCTGCREELPATPEFFWRSKYTANGLWSRCKACCMETPCLVKRTAERAQRKAQRQSAKRDALLPAPTAAPVNPSTNCVWNLA